MKLGLKQTLLASAAAGVMVLAFGSVSAQAACVVNLGGNGAGAVDLVSCTTDDTAGVVINGAGADSNPVEVDVGPGDTTDIINVGPTLEITGSAGNEAFDIDTDNAGDTIKFDIRTTGINASAVDINGSAGNDAIKLSTDNGNVTFFSEGRSTIDGFDDGLEISTTGTNNTATITVDSSSNISATGTGADDGDDGARDLRGHDGKITLTSSGTLTADNDGARISTDDGAVEVNVTGDISALGNGLLISSRSFDGGPAEGDIDVDLAGSITKVDGGTNAGAGVAILADDSVINVVTKAGGAIDNQETSALSAGILISADNQNGEDITLTIGDTITTAGGTGIAIVRLLGSDADIDITTSDVGATDAGASGGAINAELDGIGVATNDGTVKMAIGANITAGQSAVRVVNGNGVDLTFGGVNNTDVVISGAGSGISAVVEVEQTDAVSSMTNYATIRSTGTDLADQANDQAININSDDNNDNWTINNYNTIIGFINGSDAADTINNYSDNSWIVAGTNVVNAFEGGNDSIENYGRIVTAVSADVEENVFFTGVQQFNNGFPTIVGSGPNYGLLTMIDQTGGQDFVKDETFTSGDGHVFAGGEFSQLGIDAFLADANDTADFLEIDGNQTGATALVVNDINLGAGAYNPDGILFAHVTGDSPEGSFFLRNGPIDKGFFSYDILRVEGNSVDWYLVSAPNDRADELAALVTGAQTIWHQSTGVWLDRVADLRRVIAGSASIEPAAHVATANLGDAQVTPTADVPPPATRPGAGIWFRGYGGEFDRDKGVEYDQDLWGGEGGIDFVVSDDGYGAFILGILGGYLTSTMDFDSTGDKAEFEGGTLGAYASYVNGGWYADLLVKANLLDVDFKSNFDDPDADGSTDAFSIGARLDTGYRFNTDGGLFIEPQATLAYVHTDFDDLSALGTDVEFDDGESLRGRVGLRAGMSWDSGSMIFEPFLTASLWHEFEGDNEVTLTNGGVVTVGDETEDTYGEVGGGLNVMEADGSMSLFAKVDAQVGGDIESIAGSVGGRFEW